MVTIYVSERISIFLCTHCVRKMFIIYLQLAEALLRKETLTYDDVEKLLGPPPFGKKRLIEPAEFIADVEPPLPEPTPQ